MRCLLRGRSSPLHSSDRCLGKHEDDVQRGVQETFRMFVEFADQRQYALLFSSLHSNIFFVSSLYTNVEIHASLDKGIATPLGDLLG